ncbi:hypothetical protein HAX54_012850, partial [Datura stramonium]|nr:hypothetical protein [Datura stramonium]
LGREVKPSFEDLRSDTFHYVTYPNPPPHVPKVKREGWGNEELDEYLRDPLFTQGE